ncbi:uroporphyrinogen decarboxylase (plasmid) [Mycolicibacterium arabiense]|uniref:Uroporphyrinogen decarboxylase n=2 Tax=Mycolicibacterium arabiense TaxID=1286181 RepID=A0A7I7RRE6_9MYCO|nr:uroporphyrinogen decarboxylase [Mycolicibacterium arabiense]
MPVWFMRQAGRSLPEYRQLRSGGAPMMEVCFDSDSVVEITLQPVRRHGVDAAILFSDITVPLRAAGVDVDIVNEVGPVVQRPVRCRSDVDAMTPPNPLSLTAISDAVHSLTGELGDVPLIGFAGAPFTLATYLIEGGASRHFERTKAMMLGDPDAWSALMWWLAEVTITFLRVQVDAGVDAIQVFDSWSGALSLNDYRRYALPYTTHVFASLSDAGVPMTHFGVGTTQLLSAMSDALGNAAEPVLGVDWRTSMVDAASRARPGTVLQGNLDPVALLAGLPVAEQAVRAVISEGRRAVQAGAAGHIFNLGHGVLPATDPGILTEVVNLVHSL